jgi:hypothetical protein
MSYQTTKDPDGIHPADAKPVTVIIEATEEQKKEAEEAAKLAPVVGEYPPGTGPSVYVADLRDSALDEPSREDQLRGADPDAPRHGITATDYTGVVAERYVPPTPTGAHPAYPQDRGPGYANAPADWGVNFTDEELPPEDVPSTVDVDGGPVADDTIANDQDTGVTAVPAEEAEEETEEETENGRPTLSATKGEWVDWVTANYEISVEDAEAMTKADLIETYGV